MSVRSLFLSTVIALPAAFFSLAASAGPVTYSSDGTLGSITGCTNPSTCVQNGSNQVYWGGTNSFFFNNPVAPSLSTSSVLTVTDINAPGVTDPDGLNIALATLGWINRSTPSNRTDPSFSVGYSLLNQFFQPAGSGSASMSLNIQNTANPTGDLILNLASSSYISTIPGYTLGNLRFEESGPGSFNSLTSIWSNPENQTSTLTLRGDLVAVPEPASMLLFGAGLLSLGMVRRRATKLLA